MRSAAYAWRFATRMSRRALAAGFLVGLAGFLPATANAQATTLPSGFGETTLASDFEFTLPNDFGGPVAVDWAPDGRMFIAHKYGWVQVRETNGRVSMLLDLSAKVNSYFDRGLIGIAVDKDFASNGYLYLLYSHELNPLDPDSPDPMASRLTRVTVNPDNSLQNPDDPENVILGTESDAPCHEPDNTLDCIPGDSFFHSVGTVRSDPVDGTLWVGSGESHGHGVDALSYRPYDVESFAGKLIHIDRNGHGLPGHPFCPGDTDLTHVCTKIFASGFRNPIRFTLRPGRGPAVGDVGQAAREELNLVEPGKNYGWPCYEGPIHTPLYESEPRCQQEYAKEGTPEALTPPAWSYANPLNPDDGASIIAGPVYAGPNYPAGYAGKLFVGDYAAGWIKLLTIDANDQVTAVTDFATGAGSLVDLELMPNGDLAYVDIGYGGKPAAVHRITYANGNLQPTPVATATPVEGIPPLAVQFGSDSTDPEGDPLTYQWDFGDGSAVRMAADPIHTYTSAGVYLARLTVDDGTGRFPNTRLRIEVGGNQPPSAAITAPVDGSTYRGGEIVQLSGSGTDLEDGDLPGSSLSWQIVLHHGDHIHDLATESGATAEFTPLQDHDADSRYVVKLTVRDSAGRSAVGSVQVLPQTIDLMLTSTPPGAPLTYADSAPLGAPVQRTAAVGFRATIEAAPSFIYQGRTYRFANWSDQGTRKHVITVPATDTVLDASYEREVPPETSISDGPAGLTSINAPVFWFSSDDAGSEFECRLDDGAFLACTSPFQTGVLPDGNHSFAVRAADPYVGTPDPTPAARSFTVDSTAPGTVFFRTSVPASPSRRNGPSIVGDAETDSQVWLYDNADCSGGAVSGGPASDFASIGLRVWVPDNSVTELRAVAVDAAGNRSSCSSELVYIEDSRAPAATITRGPTGKTTDRTPTFRFRSNEMGSSLQCRRDDRDWKPCASPFTLRRLRLARHVFRIRAIDSAANTSVSVRRRFTVVARRVPVAANRSQPRWTLRVPARARSPWRLGLF